MDNEMIEKNMVVMMMNGDGDDDEDAADDDGWCILIFLVPNAECVLSRYLFLPELSQTPIETVKETISNSPALFCWHSGTFFVRNQIQSYI